MSCQKILAPLGVCIGSLLAMHAQASFSPTLTELLRQAYSESPSLQAKHHAVDAQASLAAAASAPDDPVLGISQLNRGHRTRYFTAQQRIRFPLKYVLQARTQNARADMYEAAAALQRLEVRQSVTVLYYEIYAAQKALELAQANIEAVREFSRLAEKRYAAGKSPQSDSMKAHFELTQLQVELMELQQEEQALQARLRAVLNKRTLPLLQLAQRNLRPPKLSTGELQAFFQELEQRLAANSPRLRKQQFQVSAASRAHTEAVWSFAPDIQLQYQERISGDPADSRIYGIGFTVPLWFWGKASRASAAAAQELAAEAELADERNSLVSQAQDLRGRVETSRKTLEIFETSLIPQAQSAFNSTRAAYRAGRTTIIDLLDSERALFRVRTNYFKAMARYVRELSQLETVLGTTVSDLGKG